MRIEAYAAVTRAAHADEDRGVMWNRRGFPHAAQPGERETRDA